MNKNLLDIFDDLSRDDEDAPRSRDIIKHMPFGYPGGKQRSIDYILPHLPYRDIYVSVFAGSAVDLFARDPSKLEVLNDRYSGIVSFFRVIRDPAKYQRFTDRIQLTPYAREEFVDSKSWENVDDDVERAARWYCMVSMSFAGLGRNFGRSTSPRGVIAGKHVNRLKYFSHIHERLKRIQIENLDWLQCMQDYDSPETVFYCDPPYIDAHPGTYVHEMSREDHHRLLNFIFVCKGFVALSAYQNNVYDACNWDDVLTWEVHTTMESLVFNKGNKKAHIEGKETRGTVTECLYIKEARK